MDAIDLCWCPPGRFVMGSPRSEPERRPGEDQVEVTLTRGFWMAKYETTQGLWQRVAGALPGPLTQELPAGDDLPVGNVNFAETEDFCRRLTERSRRSGELPGDWEFRLPTEAQWEYACRAGTTTATAFGDRLSSKQANFKGKPYNGGEPGPSLNRAAPVGSYPANRVGSSRHARQHIRMVPRLVSLEACLAEPILISMRHAPRRSEASTATFRVSRRGGCWSDDGWPCRSAFRVRFEPDRRYDHIGFRVVVVQL